ncbi:MAG: lytic transglycosylase domain-containing protein [Streptosporangiaceae bacterium]|nr:lytic transglycosylase domain-containing protein [Streptosporangiaceae bacterium]
MALASACAALSAGTATALTGPSGGAPARAADTVTLNQAVASLAAERPGYATTPQADHINAAKAAQITAKLNVASQLTAQRAAHQATQRAAAAKQALAAQAAQAAAKQARHQATQASRHQVRQSAQRQTTSPAPTGSPEQIAQAMLSQFGWPSNQMSCLQPLWQRESGWEVTAYNAGSGAYGIPQSLPGSKMAGAGADWQTNAATQIKWGLGYIKEIYGSPCAAWAHEESDGWY